MNTSGSWHPNFARWRPEFEQFLILSGRVASPYAGFAELVPDAEIILTDEEVVGSTRLLRAALTNIGRGVALTEDGHLPPPIVERIGMEALIEPWWLVGDSTEQLVLPVLKARELAVAMGLVQQSENLLHVTAAGAAMAGDPMGTLQQVWRHMGSADVIETLSTTAELAREASGIEAGSLAIPAPEPGSAAADQAAKDWENGEYRAADALYVLHRTDTPSLSRERLARVLLADYPRPAVFAPFEDEAGANADEPTGRNVIARARLEGVTPDKVALAAEQAMHAVRMEYAQEDSEVWTCHTPGCEWTSVGAVADTEAAVAGHEMWTAVRGSWPLLRELVAQEMREAEPHFDLTGSGPEVFAAVIHYLEKQSRLS